MSRQQLLFRLLEKTQMHNSYVFSQFSEVGKSQSPPTAIKRMQILQMGNGKICGPPSKTQESPFFEKQSCANNKRVLVLQRVKFHPKQEISSVHNQIVKLEQRYCSVTTVDKKTMESIKTEAQSPLKQNTSMKKTISIFEASRAANPTPKQLQSTKSEKYCMFKSTEMKSDARNSSQKNFKRKLSSSSRITKVNEVSFYLSKEEENRVKLETRKEINKNYQKAFTPPPKISAKSYIVYEMSPLGEIKIHSAYNSKIKVEIASLTKIMTCIVAIEICTNLKLDSQKQEIRIGKFESSIGGTTANIQDGQIYTLHDLLHGLMLPSGNDASIAIAVWGGKKLLQAKQVTEKQLSSHKKMKKQCYNRFIQQMNTKAIELQMTKTNYANSHGLINILNRSCAHDIAILSHYCMKNPYFAQIVSCKHYKTQIKVETKVIFSAREQQKIYKVTRKVEMEEDQELSDVDSEAESQDEQGEQNNEKDSQLEQETKKEDIVYDTRETEWENTHKLLHKNSKEYIGIKTGITTVAGPCLSSCILTPCGRKLFIVVLNCRKIQLRFKQTDLLKKWVYKKQGIINCNKMRATDFARSELDSEEEPQKGAVYD